MKLLQPYRVLAENDYRLGLRVCGPAGQKIGG